MKKLLIICGIAILVIGTSIFIVKKFVTVRFNENYAAEYDLENQELLKANRDFIRATKSKKTETLERAKTIASARKQSMLVLADSDPGGFLIQALPAEKYQELAPELQAYVEVSGSKDGQLIELHAHTKEGMSEGRLEQQEYVLKNNPDDTNPIRIRWTAKPNDVDPGDQVSIDGYILDNRLISQGTGSIRIQSKFSPESVAKISGQLSVLVIMVNFSDDRFRPATANQIANVFTNSIIPYYREASYGQLTVTNKVVGYYVLSLSKNACDGYAMANQADAQAQAAGINPATYDRIIYFSVENCWGSRGELGDRRAWVTSVSAYDPTGTNPFGWEHELGHTLGLHHANSYTCGSKSIDASSLCRENEYGEYPEIMGQSWQQLHLNAPHKAALGWLGSSQILNLSATSTGTYTISALEDSGSGYKAIVIPKADTGEKYYITYRAATGFDAILPAGITSGANVVIWNGVASRQTKALDMTPGDSNIRNASMVDGQSFVDNINKIKITQNSHVANKSVTVSINKSTQITPTPTPSKTPTATPTACSTVSGKSSTFVSQSVPTSLRAGESRSVSVTFKNNGTETWIGTTDTNRFKLGFANPLGNSTWGLVRVELPSPKTFSSCQSVTFTFTIKAPSTPGTYNFQTQMVHENVAWFGALSPNVTISVSP